jgi:hypothetical protein
MRIANRPIVKAGRLNSHGGLQVYPVGDTAARQQMLVARDAADVYGPRSKRYDCLRCADRQPSTPREGPRTLSLDGRGV